MKYLKLFDALDILQRDFSDKNLFSKYIEIFDKINNKYIKTYLPNLGEIIEIESYDKGDILIVKTSENNSIIFVNNDPLMSDGAWVKRGNIGFIIGDKRIKMSDITLPNDTMDIIKNIYNDYNEL